MNELKLTTAMHQIGQYFDPIKVSITLQSSTSMDVYLCDLTSSESANLKALPCGWIMTQTELYQLINLIESEARASNPTLFASHSVNMLSQR